MNDLRMILIRLSFLIFLCFYSELLSETYLKQISPPWGYIFKGWDGPPLDVITYIPPNATPETPLLIVIPGASRDAQRFHASWLNLAKKNHFSVLTIGARKELFPDEYSYNAGNVIDSEGNKVLKKKWLFNAIEPLFKDFKKRYNFKIKKFYLFGHSAGGGFVHRYLLFNPKAPVKKAVAANPAFVTIPDENILYPFGLKILGLKKLFIKNWLEKDMAIVLGLEDTGPRTKPLSNGKMAIAQGPNCLTRGKLLYDVAKLKAKELELDFNWDLILVPGIGHDNYGIAPQACNYLFGAQK